MILTVLIVMAVTFILIAVIALITKIVYRDTCYFGSPAMLVVYYYDGDDPETAVQNALHIVEKSCVEMSVFAVYCGSKNVTEEYCDEYDTCCKLARDYGSVFSVTYDEFTKLLKDKRNTVG